MYVIFWEFEVAPHRAAEFRSIYSSEGAWAQLFRQAPGYVGTELLASAESPTRFLTIDRWASTGDFANFQQNFREAYDALDASCEGLTLRERRLGAFTEADAK